MNAAAPAKPSRRLSSVPVLAAEGVVLYPHLEFAELIVTDTTLYSSLTIIRRVPWAVLIEQARLACPQEFAK